MIAPTHAVFLVAAPDQPGLVARLAGFFYEAGLNLVIAPLMKVLATPERMVFGLKQMVAYLHARGVTAYNEPGAIYTPDIWKLYEAILGADDTPMYSTFLVDARSQAEAGMDLAEVVADAQRLVASALG